MRFLTVLGLALLFSVTGLVRQASADIKSVYTVTDIPVRATAQTAQGAEAEAFSQAKQQGLRRLVERLTVPEDRGRIPESLFSAASANEIAVAVDVIEERRSATVYRGRLSVVYNPVRLRARLNGAGVPFIERQDELSLLVPVADNSRFSDPWRAAWPKANSNRLTPYVTGMSFFRPDDDWAAVSSEASRVRASQAILVRLSGGQGALVAQLTRLSPDGRVEIGTTPPVATPDEVIAAASKMMEDAWKREAIVRSSQRTRSFATVRYESLSEWNRLRGALTRSPSVSDFRVDAVAGDGALVTFQYSGDESRLRNEMQRSGVRLNRSGNGWTMTAAGR